MLRRHAFTLIEFLVVLAVLLVLLALLIPAVQKAREAAQQAECLNNLHQIGIALQQYHNENSGFPPPQGKRDNIDLYWAPYDDRPGATATQALPDYVPDGLIFPYLEKNIKVFRCPNGYVLASTGSQPLQLSYALNGTTNGPAGVKIPKFDNGTSNVLIVWEHSAGAASCGFQVQNTEVIIPWPFNQFDSASHYPPRHAGYFNALYCDGHVDSLQRFQLQSPSFSIK